MFSSTIIPTIARESLGAAVKSVLNQEFNEADFEIIVVNDSGSQLPDADWQDSKRVKIVNTIKRNRSVARNTGAAMAKGRYLHFLDDDDRMFPDAFENFWMLSKESGDAGWLYGAFRLVNNEGDQISDLYPDEVRNCAMQLLAWEWLPLQASLITAEAFFQVGGFASLPSLLGGFEDVDLSRQVALRYDMAKIDQVVTAIRTGEVGSTTNYIDMFRQNRQSREKVLAADRAFERLRASARSSLRPGYWSGKLVYYYLASMKWHLQKKNILTAASRLSFSTFGLLTSGRHFFSRDFWKGVIKPHYPRMGTALQEAGADHLYTETRKRIVSDKMR